MSKKKILLVEDEDQICQYMKNILEMKGWEVVVAQKSEEAVALSAETSPQAAIIDLHMPFSAYDGMEVLRRIREKDKNIRCVVVTCVDEKDRGKEAKELGATGYFEKPLDYDQIQAIIKALE